MFSMLIIIIAHIPIFTLQRQEGRIFAPMAYTIVSALLGSLLFSLTLVPVMAYFLLRRGVPHGENRLVRLCKKLYRPVLTQAVRWPVVVLAGAVMALAGSLLLATQLGSEFLPELNEGSVWVNLTLPPGISVSEAVKECAKVRSILRTFPEVRAVISKAGRPEDGTDPKQINMAEFLVDTYPQEEWKSKLSKEELLKRFDDALSKVPGFEPSFSQPIRDNILESISQIDGQIVIKVFGDDLDVIKKTAQQVLDQVSSVRGRGARVYRPGGQRAATADRNRPGAGRAVRTERRGRAERDRNSGRRQGGHPDLGGRTQVSRGGPPESRTSAAIFRPSARSWWRRRADFACRWRTSPRSESAPEA